MHTLDDYATAKAELESAQRRWENYDGNNPDKHSTSVTYARVKLGEIEDDLKNRGLLPRSEKEQLESRLDSAFPGAQSREIVDFENKRYQRRFTPRGKSLSGKTVYGYARSWEELPATPDKPN
jgi:hypothetical protein